MANLFEAPSWNSSTLEQYLKLCTYHAAAYNEIAIPYKKLPRKIGLSRSFYDVLERMRANSADDSLERWVHFGINTFNQTLYISNETDSGSKLEISGYKIFEAKKKLKQAV